MGKSRIFRHLVKSHPAVRWLVESYQMKLAILIFTIMMFSAYIFARAEDVPILEALFITIIMLLGEPTDPTTDIGKISVLIAMVAGIIFFAFIIGEFSSYLLEKIIHRGKVKVIKQYSGTGHIVICGFSDKLEGIMRELRSDALETHYPVVIISPNAGEVSFSNDALKRDTFSIAGEPLDPESLGKANLEGARSVLILSTEETVKGKNIYRDAQVALAYNTVYNYLSENGGNSKVKGNMNIVLEFLDESNNLLPCARGGDNRPEVYTTMIPGTTKLLTVEPIYLENMPRYLFIQSIIDRDVNTIVQELVNSQDDSCEFYYHEVEPHWLGKFFNSMESALLDTGVTLIGMLRRDSAMGSMVVSGYQGANRVELILNPDGDARFKEGDILVLISYDERQVKDAFRELRPSAAPQAKTREVSGKPANAALPFKSIFIINWSSHQVSDTLLEMAKMHANTSNGTNLSAKLEVAIITSRPTKEVEPELARIKAAVSGKLGKPIDEVLTVRLISAEEPFSAMELKDAGISRDRASSSRVLIVSEKGEEGGSDLRALHQLQTIENRISDEIFTAVELTESQNYHYFRNTRADVIVSIDAFAEQLMAQALLKPYVSLIFRNLLTFSEDTCEFYFREVPENLIGNSIRDIQKSLIGYPVILMGHARPLAEVKGAHTRYSVTLSPKVKGHYDDSGRTPRVLKSERLRKGDRVILIARTPEVVDAVLGRMR